MDKTPADENPESSPVYHPYFDYDIEWDSCLNSPLSMPADSFYRSQEPNSSLDIYSIENELKNPSITRKPPNNTHIITFHPFASIEAAEIASNQLRIEMNKPKIMQKTAISTKLHFCPALFYSSNTAVLHPNGSNHIPVYSPSGAYLLSL